MGRGSAQEAGLRWWGKRSRFSPTTVEGQWTASTIDKGNDNSMYLLFRNTEMSKPRQTAADRSRLRGGKCGVGWNRESYFIVNILVQFDV